MATGKRRKIVFGREGRGQKLKTLRDEITVDMAIVLHIVDIQMP